MLAVPKSIAISLENIPNNLSKTINITFLYTPSIFNAEICSFLDRVFLYINLFNAFIYALAEATIISGSEPFAWEVNWSSSNLTVTSPCASVPAVIAWTWYNLSL